MAEPIDYRESDENAEAGAAEAAAGDAYSPIPIDNLTATAREALLAIATTGAREALDQDPTADHEDLVQAAQAALDRVFGRVADDAARDVRNV